MMGLRAQSRFYNDNVDKFNTTWFYKVVFWCTNCSRSAWCYWNFIALIAINCYIVIGHRLQLGRRSQHLWLLDFGFILKGSTATMCGTKGNRLSHSLVWFILELFPIKVGHLVMENLHNFNFALKENWSIWIAAYLYMYVSLLDHTANIKAKMIKIYQIGSNGRE